MALSACSTGLSQIMLGKCTKLIISWPTMTTATQLFFCMALQLMMMHHPTKFCYKKLKVEQFSRYLLDEAQAHRRDCHGDSSSSPSLPPTLSHPNFKILKGFHVSPPRTRESGSSSLDQNTLKYSPHTVKPTEVPQATYCHHLIPCAFIRNAVVKN